MLETGGDVDGVTGQEALVEPAGGRSQDVACVDTDSEREADAMLPLELLVERLQPHQHLERRMDSSSRVILMHGRHAEGRNNRISDVLFDGSAPRLEGLAHRPREPVEDPGDPLWVAVVGEAG